MTKSLFETVHTAMCTLVQFHLFVCVLDIKITCAEVVGMILKCNDPLWKNMFENIRDSFYEECINSLGLDRYDVTRELIELYINRFGIRIIKHDDRWQEVQLPDDEQERMMLYMRFG